MNIHIEKNPDELSHFLANWICDIITETLKNNNRFTWALSGGNSPKELYRLLAQTPFKEKIPWHQLHIFFGDERDVPLTDDRNNGKMANDILLSQVPIPKYQIHFIDTSLKPDHAASVYEATLHEYFDHHQNSFDLVLLGMGDNGHSLSLFPHSELIDEKKAWVKSFYLEDQQMYRITLTPPIVNRSSRIAFLVTGENKAAMLKNVLQGKHDPDQFPSQVIQPETGELHWFVDEAAASLLRKS